jgi:hypothetical protein
VFFEDERADARNLAGYFGHSGKNGSGEESVALGGAVSKGGGNSVIPQPPFLHVTAQALGRAPKRP